ncbi:thiamine biosynthesis protein ThiF [Sulfurimonas sp.]|nr:thiamine biosynthesis protein ThiF [Sulfurimonas sp.]
MTHGFNPELTCEGIIGDGCGGGRLFTIKDETLLAYDPQTKESITLLEGVINAQSISKKACVVTVTCRDEIIEFDLSKMEKTTN